MSETNLTQQESLQIIQKMISTAKREQKDNGLGWIIWGWLLFAASVLSYINLSAQWFSQYFFWNAFGILTLVLLLWELIRNLFVKKNQPVKTYTGELFKKLNIGFFFVIMVPIIAMNKGLSPVIGFAILSGLYGFWVLIYGTIFDFKPSVIAAFITWACAFAGLFVKEFGHSMLLHAAGVMAGYIIPGHIAMNEFNKLNRK
jgi:hypothetical protein